MMESKYNGKLREVMDGHQTVVNEQQAKIRRAQTIS